MAWVIENGNKFLKDAKKLEKRNWDMKELKTAVEYLENTGTLPVITSQKYSLLGTLYIIGKDI